MRLIQLDKRLGQEFDVRMQPRMCAKKYIYIIGGYNRDRGRSWDESHTLSLVEKLDVNKDQWTTIAPMRNSRSGHAVAVLYNVVYVLGKSILISHVPFLFLFLVFSQSKF